MADVSSRNRVQRGVPTGGQFATEARGENADLEVSGLVNPRAGLTEPQRRLLSGAESLRPVVYDDGSVYDPGTLVTGNEYRTAEALERRGLGTLRYQGPSMGWFRPNRPEMADMSESERAEKIADIVNFYRHQERVPALADAIGITSEAEHQGTEKVDGRDQHQWRVTLTNPHTGEELIVEYSTGGLNRAPTVGEVTRAITTDAYIMENGPFNGHPIAPLTKTRRFFGEDYDAFIEPFPPMHKHWKDQG